MTGEDEERELIELVAQATPEQRELLDGYEPYEAAYATAAWPTETFTEGTNTSAFPRSAVVTGTSVR